MAVRACLAPLGVAILIALAGLAAASNADRRLLASTDLEEVYDDSDRVLLQHAESTSSGGTTVAGAQTTTVGNGVAEVATAATASAPDTPVLPTTPESHCQVTIGNWCEQYFRQADAVRLPPPRGDKACPRDCSGVGQCHYDFGICYCPAGYGGPDCSQPRKRPCFNMGPDKFDKGWHNLKDWSHSRCAGLCDDDLAMCYCPPETKFGRKEAPPGSPLGSAPIKRGRPMFWCQPSTDKDGQKVHWGAVTYEQLFGSDGWCNGEVPNFMCPCRLDGFIGSLCNIPVEPFCPNQCSGRGECLQGFCKCYDGWYGSDCSRLRAGLPDSRPPDQDSLKPWLQHAITPPVAAEWPAKTAPMRKRPYIYVYDMHPEYSSDVLQYRIERHHCTYRIYEHGNSSQFIGYNAYGVESMLYESFLGSEHRTYDPEEADYFFVPISFACLFDVYAWNPIPMWPVGVHGPRPYGSAMMQWYAAKWINATFPWFSRRGGRDHIWLTAHDEGACYVMKDIWPGIMLSHWGRTDFPHVAGTQYHADNYAAEVNRPEHNGNWVAMSSGAHPCFDPKKDLVIPAFKRTAQMNFSPYMGVQQRTRNIFVFFRGDMRLAPGQDPDCKYSRCIRQTLYNLSKTEDWAGKYGAMYGATHEVHGDYSDLLSRSLFCLVLPGDGWSPRMEDAVLHGCIPVMIMDGVQAVWESILDVPSFSIRIAQKDMMNVISILKAVTAEQISAMQANLAKVWQRYRYLSVKMAQVDAVSVFNTHRGENGGVLRPNPGTQFAASPVDDAFATIIQWLYARMPEVHSGAAAAGAATAA